MKRKAALIVASIFLAISFLAMKSCSSHEDTVSCFPDAPISVTLNLNLPAYNSLLSTGGWIYVDQQSAGTRGLIVVNQGRQFVAYDRNAPHICPDQNTILQVENQIKIVCPKDGAEWILHTGQPTKIANVPPKTYRCSFDPASNILNIYN